MKHGYKIIDMDTHVQPPLEVLEKYVDPSLTPRLKELDPYRRPCVGKPCAACPRSPARRAMTSRRRPSTSAPPRSSDTLRARIGSPICAGFAELRNSLLHCEAQRL